MPRNTPVWGFPPGYNPNAMNDRCELCHRTDRWVGKPVPGQDVHAWICSACSQWPPPFGPHPHRRSRSLQIPE